jgi:uncharacterized phage infection (PIP) family protein YhgE
MRRFVFLTLGMLELAVAAVLLVLGWMAGSADVDAGFAKAERVTRKVGTQVRLVRQQVESLRRPELQQLVGRLQTQTRTLTTALQTQQVDFGTVRTLADALAGVASGLDGLAVTLQPDQAGKLGDGLREAAAFLDRVIPAATKAADDLDGATSTMQADARALSVLLREAPPDLQAARQIHDSLARFGQGLDRLSNTLRPERFDALREGFGGMETSLATGAEQVERLSGYTYPAVTLNGLKPEVRQRPFWPEGDAIAKGLRKAASGVTAAEKEMDNLARDLPRLRASVDESRRLVDQTRDALARAVRQRDKLEPLLRDLPTRAANLAEKLPALGHDLSQVLRDTGRLKDVAASLHQAARAVDTANQRLPELRQTLTRTAGLLRTAHDQLEAVLHNRAQYENARQEAAALGDSLASTLPLFTDQLTGQLQDQDQALNDLGRSIDEMGDLLPAYGHAAARLLQAGQLLAWLLAAAVGLHGTYLALSARLGRRFSF